MYGKQSHVRPADAPERGAQGDSRKPARRWAVPAAAALLGATVLGAAETQAATTLIGKSKSSKEATHEEVLEHRFGGDFVQSGNNYSNGSVTVTRVDDAADTAFSSNIKSATVIGAFARKKQSFGFFDAGGEFQELVKVTGRNFDVSGSIDGMGAAVAAAGESVRFGRGGGKPEFSSDAAANEDARDHLVTYSVSGGDATAGTMLLFWEDATGRRADFDFNDLIVEITSEPLLIPLPAAAWSGLTGLAALGLVAGYKRARRSLA